MRFLIESCRFIVLFFILFFLIYILYDNYFYIAGLLKRFMEEILMWIDQNFDYIARVGTAMGVILGLGVATRYGIKYLGRVATGQNCGRGKSSELEE